MKKTEVKQAQKGKSAVCEKGQKKFSVARM